MNINDVITHLKNKRPVFVSESDFQLEFAWTIKELNPQYRVRLEYPLPFDPKKHIDIVVTTDEGIIPIELKYKTKKCSLYDGNELFILSEHQAKDQACYDYLKDISRIEYIRDNSANFHEGYAIMVTNDLSFKYPPKKQNCFYSEFSIHDGSEKGRKRGNEINWHKDTSSGTKSGRSNPIILWDEYPICWNKYSTLEGNHGDFIILTSTIRKHK